MTFSIDDGTLEEVHQQIQEQMRAYQLDLESIHVDMAPYHEQLERIHEQLEPLHDRIAELTEEQTSRIEEQMELNHQVMERHHERMERLHEQLEPLHEEMEVLSHRLEAALVSDVADVLRSHLAAVTSPDAPFDEAAARIVDAGSISIDDDVVRVIAPRREGRKILADLFEPERIGTHDAFDAALDAAVDELSDLEIAIR
jgi:hypothetical protein